MTAAAPDGGSRIVIGHGHPESFSERSVATFRLVMVISEGRENLLINNPSAIADQVAATDDGDLFPIQDFYKDKRTLASQTRSITMREPGNSTHNLYSRFQRIERLRIAGGSQFSCPLR